MEFKKLPKHVKEAGEEIASSLMDASIREAVGGDFGGCKPFSIKDFPPEHHVLIKAYLHGEISSVEAIYLAMKEAETK